MQTYLTYIVRTLLENEKSFRDTLLKELMTSYVNLTSQSEEHFVLRKVCSTLVTFFLRSNSAWRFPVRHILASLCGSQITEPGHVLGFDEAWNHVRHIHPQQLRSALWLSSSLVEEVTRIEGKGAERLVANIHL